MDQFVLPILPKDMTDMISNPHLQRPGLPMASLQESPHSHGSPWHQSQTAGGAVRDGDKDKTTHGRQNCGYLRKPSLFLSLTVNLTKTVVLTSPQPSSDHLFV